MLALNQIPYMDIGKVSPSFSGKDFVTSIIVSNGQVMVLNSCSNSSYIQYDKDRTTIFQSFTPNFGISFDIPGYSNIKYTKVGEKRVVISEETKCNLDKLSEIAALEDDWNGNGAGKFSEELIDKVRNIIIFLDIQPEVFPTACGTIQLECDKADGSHMEIEIGEETEAELFIVDNSGQERLLKISSDAETINREVCGFFE